MKPTQSLALATWLVFALGPAGTIFAREPVDPLPVAVSTPPLRTLVDRVGGVRVRTKSLLPPGEEPEGFRPGPRQVAESARARLYLWTGTPFEVAWTERLRADNPKLRIIDAGSGIDDRHSSTSETDYVWTSPPLAKRMAWRIRDALIEIDPTHAGHYRTRTARLNEELDTLDRELRGRLAPVTHRRFLAARPVWGPFAATYGLLQVPIEPAGLATGPEALVALAAQTRREGARVILLPPGTTGKVAAKVAKATGARVRALDPLAPDYFQALRLLADALADAETL